LLNLWTWMYHRMIHSFLLMIRSIFLHSRG
jgi:hypothetical protein